MQNIILEEKNRPTDERLVWLYEEISRLDRSITILLLEGFSYKETAEIIIND